MLKWTAHFLVFISVVDDLSHFGCMSNSYYFIILPLKCTKDEEKKKKKQAKHKNKNAAMVYEKKHSIMKINWYTQITFNLQAKRLISVCIRKTATKYAPFNSSFSLSRVSMKNNKKKNKLTIETFIYFNSFCDSRKCRSNKETVFFSSAFFFFGGCYLLLLLICSFYSEISIEILKSFLFLMFFGLKKYYPNEE